MEMKREEEKERLRGKKRTGEKEGVDKYIHSHSLYTQTQI